MVGINDELEALKALDVSVIAASVDDEEKAGEVAADLDYPMAYGVTREQADSLGSWWEDRRGIIQPSEFLLGPSHKILNSMYAAGPVGRMNPPDLVKLVAFMDKQRQAK
ncbi:MAG: redoxin domain-containing protein [Rhodospirillaceae bacterium]|nr:redoxin domain-containing protein [Rhodospirillaceae bacterium]MBT4042259.1 redoxin domain-containing protein [Rhodospirillaceae bacterium]MBT4687592.1 redoxin domain-containing protein [Rhodospirillaceae bacterium]MBT5082048.1 redoxin domain-containing protein [Rhodospirillaceae bacterium]MBT5524744.1 redoxin domain-containing protein [Rhodospirillaceae bacterium]